MNKEKLEKLGKQTRIGGKGTPRRKKKVVHKAVGADDKKLQITLKRLGANAIPGIEEANMFKEDSSVLHFATPKVQAAISANTFAITGAAEEKQVTDLLPGILTQLGSDSLEMLKQISSQFGNLGNMGGFPSAAATEADEGDDDVAPELVPDETNFEETANQ
eukprot:m.8678 g.8678  ORF g.8678 m.8678 type:complete len:162 (+) comp5271_c0_seq1:961-1446(+)